MKNSSTSAYEFQNFNPIGGSTQNKLLFENGSVDHINEAKGYVIQRGQVRGNNKLYAGLLKKAIYEQQPTPDGYLTEQPSGVNLLTKITNIDEQNAEHLRNIGG